jgi:hypothetical protein
MSGNTNNGIRMNLEGLLSKAMIGLCTLVLAGVVSWSSTISAKLETHVGRRVHAGAALRETTDKLEENQRLIWHEVHVNRTALRRSDEHGNLMELRELVPVPIRTD